MVIEEIQNTGKMYKMMDTKETYGSEIRAKGVSHSSMMITQVLLSEEEIAIFLYIHNLCIFLFITSWVTFNKSSIHLTFYSF